MSVETVERKKSSNKGNEVTPAKLEKFVEGSTPDVPTLPGQAPKAVPPSMPTPSMSPQATSTPQFDAHPGPTEGIEYGREHDGTLAAGSPGGPEQAGLNPEGELTTFTNPEIDPALRQPTNNTDDVVATGIPAQQPGNNTYMQPSISLSELLASQSSSRKK